MTRRKYFLPLAYCRLSFEMLIDRLPDQHAVQGPIGWSAEASNVKCHLANLASDILMD